MANLAICVSGPRRFVEETLVNVGETFQLFPFSIFVHTWADETTRESSWTHRIRSDHPKVAELIVEKRLENVIAEMDLVQMRSGSNSPVFNTVSMFYGVMQCLRCVSDSKDIYTHIVRVRSDFKSTKLLEALPKRGTVFDATNPHLPFSWVCDHFMLGCAQDMMKIWGFDDEEEILSAYLDGGRNPELLLSKRLKQEGLRRRSVFRRFVSYNIIRSQEDESDVDVIVAKKLDRFFFEKGRKLPRSRRLLQSLVIGWSTVAQIRHELGFKFGKARRNR